ncbi:MAG: DUF4363 family protein [Clostridia bacterium]|nr:DUF4363 family protein [Clostridia bacterium]
MRSFVVSVIIILICFGVSTVNCIWTRNTIDSLIQDVDHLTKDNIKGFRERWRSAEALLSFTTRRTYIRDIEDALQRLSASLENNDDYELDAAKKALIYKMKELCRSHSFDLKSIL